MIAPDSRLARRPFLASAACAALTAGGAAGAFEPPPPPMGISEALARLKEGNARFAAGHTRHAHEGTDWRRNLVAEQKPFAVILGCSDSRVPVELVFDQGFGDLFVVRVAGNVVAEDVFGSIQYAGRHLGTRLYVVLGHENCGAVTAAIDAISGKSEEAEHIRSLVRLIEPGLADLPPDLARPDLIRAAVEANVRWSVRQLETSPEGRKAIDQYGVLLVGAIYDLATGAVRFLD